MDKQDEVALDEKNALVLEPKQAGDKMVPFRIEIETGDISAEQFHRVHFIVTPDITNARIVLMFNQVSSAILSSDWSKFVSQVARRELKKWQFSNKVEPPIGSPEVRRMIAQIVTTPSYQVFLSGIELADKIGLVTESDEDIVLSRAYLLQNYVRSEYGGGLFFVQPQQIKDFDAAIIDELVNNNKLCIFRLVNGRPLPLMRYFIPYSTPNDFYAPTRASRDARVLWNKLRNLYYAFR